MNKSFEENQSTTSTGPYIGKVGGHNGWSKFSSLKWESSPGKITRSFIEDSLGDWENPATFSTALEKVEAWIFSRVVESLWWQVYLLCNAPTSLHESLVCHHR